MTKKEIKDLARELWSNCVELDMDVTLDEATLDKLSAKIVARFISLKELATYHDNLYNMSQVDWDYIDMSEEEELLAELAKLMTLMNLYTDKEEYEKCAILKAKIMDIKYKLKTFEK